MKSIEQRKYEGNQYSRVAVLMKQEIVRLTDSFNTWVRHTEITERNMIEYENRIRRINSLVLDYVSVTKEN